MSSEPQKFAATVLGAFVAAGLATDEEVGDAGGPSTTTLTKFRKVANGEMTMTEPRGDVLRRIDLAAEWRPGSARALWREGTPPEPTRTRSLSEALTGKKPSRRQVLHIDSLEGYTRWLGERVLEVEERLDLIAAQLEALSAPDVELRSVAKEGEIEESGEFNT